MDRIGNELECAKVPRYATATNETSISPIPEASGETFADSAKRIPDMTANMHIDMRRMRSQGGRFSCMESSIAVKNIIRATPERKKSAAVNQCSGCRTVTLTAATPISPRTQVEVETTRLLQRQRSRSVLINS